MTTSVFLKRISNLQSTRIPRLIYSQESLVESLSCMSSHEKSYKFRSRTRYWLSRVSVTGWVELGGGVPRHRPKAMKLTVSIFWRDYDCDRYDAIAHDASCPSSRFYQCEAMPFAMRFRCKWPAFCAPVPSSSPCPHRRGKHTVDRRMGELISCPFPCGVCSPFQLVLHLGRRAIKASCLLRACTHFFVLE